MTPERGASRVGCLLALAILILAGYAFVLYVGSEIDYRSFRTDVEQVGRAAAEINDVGIREALQVRAADLGLPPSAARPNIRRLPGNRIQITVQYQDTVTFFDRWHWVRPRRIQVDQTY